MGLGDRGKNQVKKGSPSGLFTRTEPDVTEIHTSSNTKTQNTINTEIQESLPEKNDQRKMYNISRSLSERLRKYAVGLYGCHPHHRGPVTPPPPHHGQHIPPPHHY